MDRRLWISGVVLSLFSSLACATDSARAVDMTSEIDKLGVTLDFAGRDRLPQSTSPQSRWTDLKRYDSWGPRAAQYPPPVIPTNLPQGYDARDWQRIRVVAVAQRYIGLPYQHHHIPAWNPPEGPGLDCSNFTSWVYNYGLGIKFNSDVHKQADGPLAPGKRLENDAKLLAGDLLYILKRDRSEVSHVAIYIDSDVIIDAHDGNIQFRPFKGWYKTHLSHIRRVIE